jgi:hypothetical protein
VLDRDSVWPVAKPPGAERALTLKTAPPIPVNIRMRVSGRRVTYWAEDPSGALLRGRALTRATAGGTAGEPTERDGRFSVDVSPAAGPASVSVTDDATGVTAVAEVAP